MRGQNRVPDFIYEKWKKYKGEGPGIFYAEDTVSNQMIPTGRYEFYINRSGEVGFEIISTISEKEGVFCKFWSKRIEYHEGTGVYIFYIACTDGVDWEVRRTKSETYSLKPKGEIIRDKKMRKIVGVKIIFKLFNGQESFLTALF